MKRILFLNLINAILLALAGFSFSVFSKWTGIIFVIVVLSFALYSNYVMLIRNEDDDYLLRQADRKGIFRKQVASFMKQRESLIQRQHVVEQDEKLNEVYEMVCRKVDNNIDSAIRFMEMYDYVQRPSTYYLDQLYSENQKVMQEFNDVVEEFIKIENSAHDVDSSYMDDLISSLRQMNQ